MIFTVLSRQEDETNGGVTTNTSVLQIPDTNILINIQATSEDNTDDVPNAYVKYVIDGKDVDSIETGLLYTTLLVGEERHILYVSTKELTDEVERYCAYNGLHLYSY